MRNMTLHPVIGVMVVAAFIGVIFCFFFFPPKLDQTGLGLLNTFIGLLAGMAGMVVSYYFGSSSSSRAKDDTIAAAVNNSGTGSGTATAAGTESVTVTGTVKAGKDPAPSGPKLV